MKAGQMISFIFESLPDDAQAAFATLQADGAPMAPTLAAQVVEEELGSTPEHAFLDWTDLPVAAASIGQVHRAVTHDGRDVAVKVQYPGVHDAIEHDLDAAEVMYAVFSSMMLKGLDAKGLVDELRDRMREELDYRLEARQPRALRRGVRRPPVGADPDARARMLDRSLADDRMDRRALVRSVHGRPPRPTRSSAPARWSGGSLSTPSIDTASSTATRTPATTSSTTTAASASSTSGW